ncbi:MAG: ABC transporter permease subunit [Candidatus Marsarchaeota archaeon]|jgi:NitT/TauT family transport system permease protein|nr:ABC transporter permease subunit [Candidatus Marsarchaeota archaeon]
MLGYIAALLVDISYSWIRMLIALSLSILFGLAIGIYAATHERAEKIIIPIVDILQTLPILTFFPFVIFVIVASIPGSIGINSAVIFLIITSMLWNIIFGVYEAVKNLPREFIELASLYGMSLKEKIAKIFIPASMPKVAEQSALSWSIGLFYLVTSEIFSTSNSNYAVKHGIGVALMTLAESGNFVEYLVGILIFIIFVILTRLLLFNPFEKYVNKYNEQSESRSIRAIASVSASFKKISSIITSAVPKPNIRIIKTTKKKVLIKSNKEPSKLNLHFEYIALLIIIIFIAIILTNNTLLNEEITVIFALITSFIRVWFAFLVILIIAVPLSIYIIFMAKRRSTYVLLFQIIAAIPATILLPLIVASLKNMPYNSELVAFSIFFLSGIWYIIFSILSQKTYISQSIFEVKKIFGVKGIKAWKKIYIYAILPGLLTGAVTGIAAEWNASIVAEYFTTSAIGNGTVITTVSLGIGKLLDVALNSGNMQLMLLGLFNLTLMIIFINKFVWKKLYNRIGSVYK